MAAELHARHRKQPRSAEERVRLARTPGAPGSPRGPATLSLIGGVQGFIPVPDSHHRGGPAAVVTPPVRFPVVGLRGRRCGRRHCPKVAVGSGWLGRPDRLPGSGGEGTGHRPSGPARRRRARPELPPAAHARPRPADGPRPRPGVTHDRNGG